MVELTYLSGFNNQHESEALPGALPEGQFSPQKCAYGLYAEQFSTSSFTAPRAQNRRTWMYRIQPSVSQGRPTPIDHSGIVTAPYTGQYPHEPLRWLPLPAPEDKQDFFSGLTTIAVNGDPMHQQGLAIHIYRANQSMNNRYFYSADGELLIIPQHGCLTLATELGQLKIAPHEIAVIPRGMKFKVSLDATCAYGYVCENYGLPFQLPERGPVGANGFANERDFLYPCASYEDDIASCEVIGKFAGKLFSQEMDHSPLNVVAWAGNSAPYKYDLLRFNTMGSLGFDHPDPSIFTVLSSPSDTPGMANADFVIFPPRWVVSENTFRPPWYHRNIMSEFMGLIEGTYDAKKEGFVAGGMSLHNAMTPHGPDAASFAAASEAALAPEKIENSLAFMLESRYPFMTTSVAMSSASLDQHYVNCWAGLDNSFNKQK